MDDRASAAPLTRTLAGTIAGFSADRLPDEVLEQTRAMVRDGAACLRAAANPAFSTGQRISAFVHEQGGNPESSVVGHAYKTGAAHAALANGTMGYACDFEPHHPEAILHPIAIMLPVALAMAERQKSSGRDMLAAVALGCEVEYRVSMAIGPVEMYDLGFHPSSVAGCFGATAAAAFLRGLDEDAVVRALGLAGCQASGMMAWESDPTENARPFQMGVAGRNGVTAALLAAGGFGGPMAIFDHGHTMFKAYSRDPRPDLLTADLGAKWDGIMELAIKPYSSVSFLHPALDALLGLVTEHDLKPGDVTGIELRFPTSGVHCVDGNPLKSHCAQYILPVAVAQRRIEVADLFVDRRETDAEVARLSAVTRVVADDELNKLFPDFYASIVRLETASGETLERRNDIARGYPESPISQADLDDKFYRLVTSVTPMAQAEALSRCIEHLKTPVDVTDLAALLSARPEA